MNDGPMISVVMSVFNGETLIKKTMESILTQTYKNFELILVNDCSTDNTLMEISNYCDDKRIELINNETNLGLTKSLIKGILEAKGKYIARIDAGDLMNENRLAEQVRILDSCPNVGLVSSFTSVEVWDNGKLVHQYRHNTDIKKVRQKLPYVNPITHVAVMFRKGLYQSVGGYDKNLSTSQDYDLWIRMKQVTDFYVVEDYLTKIIYFKENSISYSRNKTQILNGIKIRLKHIKKGNLPVIQGIIGILKASVMYFLPQKLNNAIRIMKKKLVK